MSELGVSRRNIICGFVAAGAAVPLVAACGGSDTPATTPSAGGGGATTPAATATSSAAAPSGISTAEIPVGGGKVFADKGFAITQPTAGEFKAFASQCTHQGTTLNNPANGVFTCPLHGSQFSIEDGKNEAGPSGSPAGRTPDLPEKTVTKTGTTLTVS